MRLQSLLQSFQDLSRAALNGRMSSARRRRTDDRTARPFDWLEPRLLLTVNPDQPIDAPGGPLAFVSERFDANSSLDLITLSASGELTVALNGGDGTWRSLETLDLPLSGGSGLAVGRINADGAADLAIQTPDGIAIALGDGQGRFEVSSILTPALPGQFSPGSGQPVQLTLGLFDQDLLTDLAVVVPGTNELLVYRGQANASFSAPIRISSGGMQPVSVVSGQFVGDPAPDLAVGHRDGTIALFEGSGTGDFVLQSSLSVPSAGSSGSAAIQSLKSIDLNGDEETDLAVTAGDTAVVFLNSTDSLRTSPIVNGAFDQGLSGWTIQSIGHSSAQRTGQVSGLNGFATLVENESFLTSLQQTFTIPANAESLSFDVRSLSLPLSLTSSSAGIPDAFEVSLLSSSGESLVATHQAVASSFFNIAAGEAARLADGVLWNGTTVTLDVSGLAAGTTGTLVFDLVGHPPETVSSVIIDNVVLLPEQLADNSFSMISLPGPFTHATGVDAGQLIGDGLTDLIITDRGTGQLILLEALSASSYTRTVLDLTSFGLQPTSVITSDLIAGGDDEVAVGLFAADRVLSPLTRDVISPDAVLISPQPDTVNAHVSDRLIVEFSESMRDRGILGSNSVVRTAAWQLIEAGADTVFGTTDDLVVPITSVAYDRVTDRATLFVDGSFLPDGYYRLNIEADDVGLGLTDLSDNRLNNGVDLSFEFTVNSDGPEILSLSNPMGSEGSTLHLMAAIIDPGGRGPYSATIDWGDGTTSTIPVTMTNDAATLHSTHTWFQNGSYSVVVTVTDGNLVTTSATTTAVIFNAVPQLEAIDLIHVNEGEVVTVTTSFTDPGIEDQHAAIIDWGDGSSSAGTVSFNDGDGIVTGTHAYSDGGQYTVTLSLSDDGGGSASTSTSASVQNSPPIVSSVPPVSGSEGSPVALTASFTDGGTSDSHIATIHWGDGTSSPGTVTSSGGQGTITGSHVYGDDGVYAVTVSISDSDGLTTSATGSATILNVAPTLSAAVPGDIYAGFSQPILLASFADPGFSSAAGSESFTATINWGDGSAPTSGLVETINGSAGVPTTGTITGTHEYAEPGTYTVTVTLTDDAGQKKTVLLHLTANEAPEPPAVTNVFVSSVEEGSLAVLNASFTDSEAALEDSVEYSATISWGDGTTSPSFVSFEGGQGSVIGTHYYADDGNFAVTVRILGESPLAGVGSTSVSIFNANPQVFSEGPQSVELGTSISGVLATFTDAGFTRPVASASETFLATIDWGDGLVESGSLVVANGQPTVLTQGSVSGTHAYSATGNYSITITVSDDDDDAGMVVIPVTVTSPPNPPQLSGSSSVAEGSVYSVQLDPGSVSPLAWIINWGDGSPLETLDGSVLNAYHTFVDNQTVSVTATASSNLRSLTTAPLIVDVTNVAPDIQLAGLSTTGMGASWSLSWSATDPGADTITAWIVNWGDGATSTVDGSMFAATHVYLATGAQNVTVSAVDEDGSFASQPFALQVVAVTGNKPRFFVADSQTDQTYRYGTTGSPQGSFGLGPSNNVRGITTTGAGDPIWTVDNDDRVYVYDPATGDLLGSWTAGTINNPEDIATDGTDIWILDRADDRIYRYAGAASRRGGQQPPTDSLQLHQDNRDGYGLATDGDRFWVVDKNAGAVFVYNLNGTFLGRWSIDPQNKQPTGITLDPGGSRDVWIVDLHHNAVFRYENSKSLLSGSQNAADSFQLGPGNVRPEGLADPVYAYSLNTVISSDISVIGEVDDYQFTATAGQQVFVDLQQALVGSIQLRLLSPTGATVVTVGSNPTTGNPQEADGFQTLPVSGTYTLRVNAPNSTLGQYQFAVYEVPDDPPTRITLDTVYSGAIETPGSYDNYLFDVTAGQTLMVDYGPFTVTGNIAGRLYAPDGSLVFGSLNGADYGPIVFNQTGLYRLNLDGSRDSTGTYQFQVRDVSPVIRPLQLDQTVSATITAPFMSDIWQFNASSGQRIYFDMLSLSGGLDIRLKAPDGTTVYQGSNFVLSAMDFGPTTLNQTGLWSLQVTGSAGTIQSYSFRIWNIPEPDTSTAVMNDLYAGVIEFPGRQDVLEIHGYAGQQLFIDFQQNNTWIEWNLRRPDGTLLNSASSFLVSQLDSPPVTLPVDGVYRLTIGGRGDSVGDFQVRVFDITPPAAPTPIVYDQIVTGSLNRPGQAPRYSFTATAGTSLQLDVLFNEGNALAWTLLSPSGSTIFTNSTIDRTISSLPLTGTYIVFVDQVGGGSSDTTGQFSFRVINPTLTPPLPAPADLVVSTVMRPASAVGSNISINVTWTVTNNGTGPTSVSQWVDRIYLSADNLFQRASERIAGEFVWNGTLAPGASYTRTELISIPAGYEGDLTVIVETDSLNQVFELLNEANNTRIVTPTAFYQNDFLSGPPAILLNVTDGQKFPTGSTVSLGGLATTLPATANLVFAVDLSDSTRALAGSDANLDGIANDADDLNGDGYIGDILDSEIGALLRVVQSLRDNNIQAHVAIVAFASFAEYMDLSPRVFRQTFVSPTADDNRNGIYDIDEAALSLRAGGVGKFRPFEVSIGTNFSATTTVLNEVLERRLPAEKTQVLFLTDGASAAPSLSALNTLADYEIDFFGFQISGTSVSSQLQFMATSVDAHPVSTGRSQLISDPEDLSAALLQSLRITSVHVGESAVQALDVAGNFFTTLTIQTGANPVTVTATDTAGRTIATSLTLIGVDPASFTPTQTQDVTSRATLSWSGTTFNRSTQELHADLTLTNISDTVLDAPVLAVFDAIEPLNVALASVDGLTDDSNHPFVRFDTELFNEDLAPGQSSAALRVRFANSSQKRFAPEVSLRALGNSAPWFESVPSIAATTDVLWTTPLLAVDPEGHELSYQLLRGPVGMSLVISENNTNTSASLEWTPTLLDTGIHDVQVQATDGRGGRAVQQWQLGVSEPIPLPNLAPWFRSEPIAVGTVSEPYSYIPTAIDPEGLNVTWELVSGPAGLALSNIGTTALGTPLLALQWIPDAEDLGSHPIQLRATDPSGQAAYQSWTLQIKGPNIAPEITTTPLINVTAGSIYRYDADAIDAEDRVTYALIGAPAGLGFDTATGQITWQTTAADLGTYPLTIQAIDERGAITSQPFVLTVSPDTRSPNVTISLSSNAIRPGETVTITVHAADNVSVISRTLTLAGTNLILDSNHQAVFTAVIPGMLSLSATATDAEGNVGSDQFTLRVIDPTDTIGPVISVTSPQPADVVTYLTDIVGSIADDHLESYSVAWSPLFADQWTTFFSQSFPDANGSVTDATLATFDPTLLTNDAWEVRITATDLSGNISTFQFELNVEGNAKIGNFHLDFVDLTMPLAGIPITITRSYDTMMAGLIGDFGYGWTMRLAEGRIRETRPIKPNESLFDNVPFRMGTRVYIDSPTGRRVAFTFDPAAEESLLGTMFYPRFTADPGVHERLEVESIPLRQNSDGTFKLYFGGFDYNPRVYTLITKDQLRYTYDQFDGLLSIQNRNDVRLVWTDTGVSSSVGESITWTRDALGRITQITDPNGNPITYSYSLEGDLISVADQLGNATTMSYLADRPHFLSQAIDSLGNIDFTATFDDSGRLHTLGDALGSNVAQTYDLANNQEVVSDRLGNESTLTYDDRGNVTSILTPLGAVFGMTYDEDDNQTSVTDPLGRTTSLFYDDRGNITQMIDAAGGIWTQVYSAANELLMKTDPLGRTQTRVYDERGNLVDMIDPTGHETHFIYDALGRVTSVIEHDHGHDEEEHEGDHPEDEHHHDDDESSGLMMFSVGLMETTLPINRTVVTSYEYSTTGTEPTQVTNPDGTFRKATYSRWGELTSVTNERGFTTNTWYDAVGRPTRTVDALGGEMLLEYEGSRLASVTDQMGRRKQFEYDEKDRRIHEIDAAGGIFEIEYDANDTVIAHTNERGHKTSVRLRSDGLMDQITDPLGRAITFTFDAAGNRTSLTDQRGYTTHFAYDELDRIVRMTDPLGGVWDATWDAVGNRTSFTDANGHTTQFAYDENNRIVETIDALGGIWSQTWDSHGSLLSSTDALGRTTALEYDDRHRLISVTDPAGFILSRTWDEVGNLLSVTDEMGSTTTFEYDPLNRRTRSIDPLGHSSHRGYDAIGNVVSFTDALGRTTAYEYDLLDRQTSSVDPRGAVTSLAYDAVGNLLSFTDAVGNVTQYEYDAADQLLREIDPLGAVSEWQYDFAGNPTSYTDRLGRITELDYDAVGRLTLETWRSNATIANQFAYTYDPVGNLLTADDDFSHYTFTYDELDRRVTSDNTGTPGAVPLQLTNVWDAVGNPILVTDNFGVAVTSTYDERDLLTSRAWSGPQISARADFQHNGRGQRTGLTRFADAAGTSVVGRSEYQHDAKSRLTSITHHDALDTVFSQFDMYYDEADQLIRRDVDGLRSDYVFDDVGQLTSVDHTTQPDEAWTWDATGNRTNSGQVIGANNQLLSDSQYSYTWDADGNLATRTSLTDGSISRFVYDHRNRLTQVTVETSAGQLTLTSEFTYDAFDRRISKTVDADGAGPSTAETITFGWNANDIWLDGDTSGSVTARYLSGPETDDLIARHRPSDGLAWYLTDQVGSITALVDSAGQVINQVTYDSFGNVLSQTSPAAGDRYLFTGREYDPETGLYYYRARYYSPSIGIFISQDPLSFAAGDANLTRYVGNMPTMFSDPFGLMVVAEAAPVTESGLRAGSSIVGGTIGFACGYVEAWYSGNPNPLKKAVEEAVIGVTLGLTVGGLMKKLPGDLQGIFGAILTVKGLIEPDDPALNALRTACLIAELAAGGAFGNFLHGGDGLRPPKSLADWMDMLARFTGDETAGHWSPGRGRVPSPISRPIAPAKRNSQVTVLGRNPLFITLSDKLGARRFEIPLRIQNSRMTTEEVWSANRKFLDRTIRRGDRIVLSNSALDAEPGTFFHREINYLVNTREAYTISSDGMSLIPVRR
jgi:RHS repeat-associated protein